MSQSTAEKMAMEASLAEAPPSRRVPRPFSLLVSMHRKKPFNASANPWPRASVARRAWWYTREAGLSKKAR